MHGRLQALVQLRGEIRTVGAGSCPDPGSADAIDSTFAKSARFGRTPRSRRPGFAVASLGFDHDLDGRNTVAFMRSTRGSSRRCGPFTGSGEREAVSGHVVRERLAARDTRFG
jgi:hypothetical protein